MLNFGRLVQKPSLFRLSKDFDFLLFQCLNNHQSSFASDTTSSTPKIDELKKLTSSASFNPSTSTLNSDISPILNLIQERQPNQKDNDCFEKLGDLSFGDTQEAFKSKTNYELWRALFVLKLCSYKFVVEHNTILMQIFKTLLSETLFRRCMQATIYGHFVAGQDESEIKPSINRMMKFGVKSILDYSVEADVDSSKPEKEAIEGIKDRREGVVSARTYFYESERQCDENVAIFEKSIDSVRHYTKGAGFSVIKMTALSRPELLLRLSDTFSKYRALFDVVTRLDSDGTAMNDSRSLNFEIDEQKFYEKVNKLGLIVKDKKALETWFKECDHDRDGTLDIFEWSRSLEHKFKFSKLFKIVNLRKGKIEELIPGLDDGQEEEFRNLMRRLDHLATYASDHNIRMMIDAEQTYLQPAIGGLTLELMKRYNKKKAVIFNTYQAYLKNARRTVAIDLGAARHGDFYFGAKLVRGAYMDQERRRAKSLGLEDPINVDYDTTTTMYDKILNDILEEVKRRPLGKVSVMCATHNEDTVRRVLQAMKSQNIGPSQAVVCFGQLYGMCDQVSFSLGQAGFSVYKYVPYGPVEGVVPYLSRRVQENGGALLQKSERERQLIRRELWRRFKTLKFVHPVNVTV